MEAGTTSSLKEVIKSRMHPEASLGQGISDSATVIGQKRDV
jgi:hypothetical protein